jgi:PhoPQ-activated pathogenicity-related protein
LGGYLTCIVSGLDNRFKAAVPVYGCGFLHENSVWLKWFNERFTKDQTEKWVTLWDPSKYVGSASMPMLFVNGGTDFAYPPDSHCKTYRLVQSPKNLYYVPELKHGHIFDRPKEIQVFFNSILKKNTAQKPLHKISIQKIEDRSVTASVQSLTKVDSAEIHHSADPLNIDNRKRKWMSQSAQIHDNHVRADIPTDFTIWFITVTDEFGLTISSELQFVHGRKQSTK